MEVDINQQLASIVIIGWFTSIYVGGWKEIVCRKRKCWNLIVIKPPNYKIKNKLKRTCIVTAWRKMLIMVVIGMKGASEVCHRILVRWLIKPSRLIQCTKMSQRNSVSLLEKTMKFSFHSGSNNLTHYKRLFLSKYKSLVILLNLFVFLIWWFPWQLLFVWIPAWKVPSDSEWTITEAKLEFYYPIFFYSIFFYPIFFYPIFYYPILFYNFVYVRCFTFLHWTLQFFAEKRSLQILRSALFRLSLCSFSFFCFRFIHYHFN